MNKILTLIFSLFLIFLVGCSNSDSINVNNSDNNIKTKITSSILNEDSTNQNTTKIIQNQDDRIDINKIFTDQDKEVAYDEKNATQVTLSNQTITIDNAGVYILSGSIEDGQIIVNVSDTEKVQLILNNINVNSSNSAPIYIKSADKVFITLASGTKNILSTTGEYFAIDENNIDGVVFSKSDICFNGNGSLVINNDFGHGIVGKDNVIFTSGNYTITTSKKGISANDSVRIADGTINITSEKDAIQVENSKDTEKGFFYMANGTLNIKSQQDAISASGIITIDGGNYNLITGLGAQSVMLKKDEMPTGGFPKGDMKKGDFLKDDMVKRKFSKNGMPNENFQKSKIGQNMKKEQDTVEVQKTSQKGLKSDSKIFINNGNFNIDTIDDGIHSNSNITILNGSFDIKSGDDGIHSDAAIVIEGGNFNIPYCYEGIEGLSITVNGGAFNIISSDDGLNAAGDAVILESERTPDNTTSSDKSVESNDYISSATVKKEEHFRVNADAFITINDGDITIVSDGDSLDSNGALTINGGILNLTCNGNGNTTIDTSGVYENNGGYIKTNDGGEKQIGK